MDFEFKEEFYNLKYGKCYLIDEKENLYLAPLYITYEQVMRFLMDYIDGDTYYKTAYPGHNLVRTRAQMKLMESMEENLPFMQQTIKENI